MFSLIIEKGSTLSSNKYISQIQHDICSTFCARVNISHTGGRRAFFKGRCSAPDKSTFSPAEYSWQQGVRFTCDNQNFMEVPWSVTGPALYSALLELDAFPSQELISWTSAEHFETNTHQMALFMSKVYVVCMCVCEWERLWVMCSWETVCVFSCVSVNVCFSVGRWGDQACENGSFLWVWVCVSRAAMWKC